MNVSSALKIAASLTLILALGACSSKTKKEDENVIGQRGGRAPDSALSGAAGDLRKSSKFSTLSQNIRFNVGSSELNASSRRALNEIASELKNTANSYEKIRISGLTDPQGDADRNLRLSEARATRVRDYLVSRGVPEDKLETVGKGAVARDTLGTSSQMARDRRVDFEIVE
ncbi:OmpA family protein [Bdellovibrio bacteriovorus]|uniref:OmpA family protein n=1 Tax=Bdellovibrio bacteriovorus TaxID=959 RepID=UPI003D065B61